MAKEITELKLGLDIGTNSVGWALLDQDNELVQKNTKDGRFTFWGVRMFDESKDAKARRTFRSSRRRIERRKQRIGWLQEIFKDQVEKVDSTFFERLEDSFYVQEDKRNENKYNLFNNQDYTDIDFNKEFRTIYHLRQYLMNKPARDVRFLYIALHHIIKYRGNFLTPGDEFNVSDESIVENYFEYVNDMFDEYEDRFDQDENPDSTIFAHLDNGRDTLNQFNNLMSMEYKISARKEGLLNIFKPESKSLIKECIVPLLSGSKIDMAKLALVKDEGYEKLELSLQADGLDEKVEEARAKMPELSFLFNIILETKKIYDHYYVLKLLGTSKTISEAMIERYKEGVKHNWKNGEERFKLRNASNGALPMQLHLAELKKILNFQKQYYPFLNEVSDGCSNIDKIILIFRFKLPYYIGPLNDKSDKAWVVRKSYNKITPWNFNEIVDVNETALRFIQRMQNKCTYLNGPDDYCLPKRSIIFQKYDCLSYLNKISINGKKISKEEKEKLFNEVFLKHSKPKKNMIVNFFKKESNGSDSLSDVTTTNGKELPEVNCSMSSYIKFKGIYGDDFGSSQEEIEKIIKDLAIFEDKEVLEGRLRNDYHLDESKIKQIKSLNYTGFSSLSKRFIDGLEIDGHGTLLDVMWNTNLNLNEILYDENYKYQKIVDDYNKDYKKDFNNVIDFLKEYTTLSPIWIRPVIQTVHIIDEIERILGRSIDKYYVECARTNKEKKKTTQSRYEKIKTLYKSSRDIIIELTSKENYNELINELENYNPDSSTSKASGLQSDAIYLYFTQLGRCMYTLEPIDINQISTAYDIDHIYPQSLIKDDSLTNRVLTKKSFNNDIKSDKFLFEISDKMNPNRFVFYKKLFEKDLISKEKYRRLTQKMMTEEELNGFVNRQIVATNQSVKALVKILKEYKGVSQNNIIESKAEHISDFRHSYDVYKSRTANNFHHAHDAYLNVVIGGIIDNYYKRNCFYNFKDYQRLKSEGITVNPKQIIKWFFIKNDSALERLKHDITGRFDINETVMTLYGKELCEQTILPKNGIGGFPIKSKKFELSKEKYGGKKAKYSRFCIIKKKNKYYLEAIPKLYETDIRSYFEKLQYSDYLICCENIKINCLVEENKLHYYITGRYDEGNIKIVNANDRIFAQKFVNTIRKIDKFIENSALKKHMVYGNDFVVVSPAKNRDCGEIKIDNYELNELFIELKNKLSLPCFTLCKSIKTLVDCMNSFSFQSEIVQRISIISKILRIAKTNSSDEVDLSEIGAGKKINLKISTLLKPGQTFISESITGFYKKVLFKVPE